MGRILRKIGFICLLLIYIFPLNHCQKLESLSLFNDDPNNHVYLPELTPDSDLQTPTRELSIDLSVSEILEGLQSNNPILRRQCILYSSDMQLEEASELLREIILRTDTLREDKLLAANAMVNILKDQMDWKFGLQCLYTNYPTVKETGLQILSHMTQQDLKKWENTEFFNLFREEVENILESEDTSGLQIRALSILKQMQEPLTIQLLLEMAIKKPTMVPDLSITIAEILENNGFGRVRSFESYQDIPENDPLREIILDSGQFLQYQNWYKRTLKLINEYLRYEQSAGDRQRLVQAKYILEEGPIKDEEVVNLMADLGSHDLLTSIRAERRLLTLVPERINNFLMNGLEDENYLLQQKCIKLLGKISDSRAIDKLEEYVNTFISKNRGWNKKYTEKDKELAISSILSLGEMRHEKVYSILLKAIEDDILLPYALTAFVNSQAGLEQLDVEWVNRQLGDYQISTVFNLALEQENWEWIKTQLYHSKEIYRIYAAYLLIQYQQQAGIEIVQARLSNETDDKVQHFLDSILNNTIISNN